MRGLWYKSSNFKGNEARNLRSPQRTQNFPDLRTRGKMLILSLFCTIFFDSRSNGSNSRTKFPLRNAHKAAALAIMTGLPLGCVGRVGINNFLDN